MPTQHQGYFLADRTRVPSVTTVIGFRKEAGGLIHWAWSLGKEGRDYREERDSAADAGTLGHAMIESYTKGLGKIDSTGYTEEQIKLAIQAYLSFRAWADSSKFEIVASEVPMVSEKYRVGGTLDAVARVNGELAIVDYKTGAVYYDAIIQTAMYRELWNETHPDQLCGDRVHILRVGKDHADFVHRSYKGLDDAVQAFVAMRQVYQLCNGLRKRAV